jgi:glyoxylase-like metal-dependent hydrolase (beta-lactamase superfamily II)
VGLSLDEVTAFWGLPRWPEGEAAFDLGGRRLTVFPIPGHEATHVALWDERTGVLIAGDTLYPGLLTVRDWPAFRASAARMARFAQSHPVTMVLGHHVEMACAPGVLYPPGTRFQPDEHPLPLPAQAVHDLCATCEAMAETPQDVITDHFAIEIRPGAVPGRGP